MCFFKLSLRKVDVPTIQEEETHSDMVARHLDEISALKRQHNSELRARGYLALIEQRLSEECRRSKELNREAQLVQLEQRFLNA